MVHPTQSIPALQKSALRRLIPRPLRQLIRRWRATRNLGDFSLDPASARARYGRPEGDLAKLFFDNGGRTVDKWLHYLPVYERYLERYRGTDFAMLEIGVFKGGSLELWRRYFGPAMKLFGIDINPACADYVDPPNQVRIGSQADPAFLANVCREIGRIDVVLDDGSHIAEHQQASFEFLFPLLADGGLYIIEDIHTAYWANPWQGGYRRRGTAIELVKDMIDDLHHWYHHEELRAGTRDIGAIHVYDSIVVIEKAAASRPITTRVGPDAALA